MTLLCDSIVQITESFLGTSDLQQRSLSFFIVPWCSPVSFHMGSLVGRIAEETPTYSLVKEYSSFQVRHYAPRLVTKRL